MQVKKGRVELWVHDKKKRWFFWRYIQSKSSIEETDDLASDVSLPALLVGEDALGGWEDEMSKLPGGEDVAGPLLEFGEDDVVSGWDDSTFVDPSNKFDNDFLASVVIDNLELSDIVVFLHNPQEFNEDLGDGSEEHLFLAFSFSIDDGFEGISEDIDFHHCGR